MTDYSYDNPLEVPVLPKESDATTVIIDVRNEEDQNKKEKFGRRKIIGLPTEGLKNFETYISQLDTNTRYLLVCYKGIRSLKLTKIIQKKGFNASSLKGGYTAL